MQLETQVIARNTKAQPVVLSSDPKGTEFVEWAPLDDPTGNDVQIIPEVIARSAQFARLLQKGIVEIVQADDSYMEAVNKQRAAFDARLAGPKASAEQSMVRETQNNLVSTRCIGPDARGTGQCVNHLPVRAKNKDERPPLCSTHESLAPQYISYEEEVPVSEQNENQGPTRKKWSRSTITDRQSQIV